MSKFRLIPGQDTLGRWAPNYYFIRWCGVANNRTGIDTFEEADRLRKEHPGQWEAFLAAVQLGLVEREDEEVAESAGLTGFKP